MAVNGDRAGGAMSDPAGLLLSVQGEARRMVAPDYAIVAVTVSSSQGSKAEAVRTAAAALASLTADLAARGGVALDASTGRRPLTWSAQSVATYPERARGESTGEYEPTGQVTAAVDVTIAVRDFGLLEAMGAVLAAREAVAVHQVTWDVDWDNPAWPGVRADAVRAAIAKGRDYAAALGVALLGVEHVADAGLLGGSGTQFAFTGRRSRALSASAGHGEPDAPSLDPVPQELAAIVEARLTAGAVSLAAPPDSVR
jgi:uncharacterized protein YggE